MCLSFTSFLPPFLWADFPEEDTLEKDRKTMSKENKSLDNFMDYLQMAI
jgi:hypothetical protein